MGAAVRAARASRRCRCRGGCAWPWCRPSSTAGCRRRPLPSSRELALLLGLSRNTVTSAYLQLIDEGFLEARPRSGVFVRQDARPLAAAPAEPLVGAAGRRAAARLGASACCARWSTGRRCAKPERWRDYPYPFVYGTYDPQLFPTEDFRECCARSLARSQLPHWTPDFETDDVPDLIEQIRTRLLPKRGVFALKEEIIVTVGAQHAYYLLAEALFDETTRVGLEEPGHPHARNSFALRQPRWVEVAVDDEGLVVDALPARRLPVRHALAPEPDHGHARAWSAASGCCARPSCSDFVLIEDDYEAENLYAGAPMPALKSLDQSGRVIYVGSVSKSLSPALRLGYIVAPRALIEELRVLRHAMLRHPSAFLQHAYALFLSLGHHESHARRVNPAMQERLALAAAGAARAPAGFRVHAAAGRRVDLGACAGLGRRRPSWR